MKFNNYIREKFDTMERVKYPVSRASGIQVGTNVSFYQDPTRTDIGEIEKEMKEKGERHLGERYTLTNDNKFFMWTADVNHDAALMLLREKYPTISFRFRITYDKANNEYWGSTKDYYFDMPEELREKLLKLHPNATFEAS